MTGPRTTPFDLTFAPALWKRLAAARESPATANMIPGFLLGRVNDEETDRLIIGYYEPERAAEHGAFELFETEGIRFFIPQPRVRKLLAGKRLHAGEVGRLTVQPRRE